MLVEINCETDFVAKNEQFLEFTSEVAKLKLTAPDSDFEDYAPRRWLRSVRTFFSHAMKNLMWGVLGWWQRTFNRRQGRRAAPDRCRKEDILGNDDFKALVKDITLHIAASAPVSVSRDEVDPNW
ncbi:MAG: hypothetical protein CM1200mP29_10350 [Verrucomicrobiota bacterium]|nr:MAG: hypothetical protein CM1200mP29_10350 [Verrucomicrobiota bacterium]